MEKPTFSIIVPVYKLREEYFHQCVTSILGQTYTDFELVLVDDGSPDNCGKLCDEYAGKDSRIRVIHQENQGVSVARNNGIRAATADWVWFVDGDDWVEKDSLEILNTCISQEPDVDIFQFCACLEKRDKTISLDCSLDTERLYELSNPEDRLFLYRRMMGAVQTEKGASAGAVYYSWDKLIRRDAVLKNGLVYPVGIPKSEDKVFFCLCLEKIKKLRTIPNQLYHYRLNTESVCRRFVPDLDRKRLQVAQILIEIARRMDEELAIVLQKPGFHGIYDECTKFLFQVITDVLLMCFHHKDNPNRKTWRRDALRFLETEPFKSAINDVPYSSLSKVTKVKKILLQCRCVSIFCKLHSRLVKIRSARR